MCGLALIIAPQPTPDLAGRAARMLERLRHRGPNGEGLVVFRSGREVRPGQPASLALAHNRLAIQDLSDAGRQPVVDPGRRKWLIFNGEIYNFIELREQMQREGETFHSRCDSEVLHRVLMREGEACLSKLDGMFAFILLDLDANRLLIARDRFGIKPLYWWRASDDSLLFASEIKAFIDQPGWDARLNHLRAMDFLTRGLIDHTPGTLFAGVHQVPAGGVIEIDLARPATDPQPKRWYDLEPIGSSSDINAHSIRLRELLTNSVSMRLRADVTVGSCLSGGLDSSSIVCTASRLRSEQKQMTFTARVPGSDLDEWRYAEEVAKYAHAIAVPIELDGSQLFDRLDDLVYVQDEPFASPSIFAQVKVFEAARANDVIVMLDGQGADEQLAGYHSFLSIYLRELIGQHRFSDVRANLRAWSETFGYSPWKMIAQVLASRSSTTLRRRLRRDSVVRSILCDDVASDWPGDPFDLMTGRTQGVTAFSMDQLFRGSLPMLLHWEDRSSMTHSIEARVPFLSHELVEFTLGLPSAEKVDGAMTKYVLREAMREVIPESVRVRTDKIAFATPHEQWLTQQHQGCARAALDRAVESMDGLMKRSAGRSLHAMIDRARPYDPILWRIICFGAWMKRFAVRV